MDNEHDGAPGATAISVGDGSLGGAAIGGSVTGPDAGVIHDPVGPDVAVPLTTNPDPTTSEGDLGSDDMSVRDASLGQTDPEGGRSSAS